MMSNDYRVLLERHYAETWGEGLEAVAFPRSPHSRLPCPFAVLTMPQRPDRDVWTYATCGMSDGMAAPIELYALSDGPSAVIPEFMAAIASFHHEIGGVGLGDTAYLGKGWAEGSLCEHALVSLPYLDGPVFGTLDVAGYAVNIYWLLPLTRAEVEFKKAHGLEALEEALESSGFNYLDMMRESVV